MKDWKALSKAVFLVSLPLVGIGNYLANLLIRPKPLPYVKGLEHEISIGSITKEEYEGLQKEAFSLRSKRGHLLKGEWLTPDKPSDKVVIICHGFQVNRARSYQYAQLFLKRGFHVCVYDHVHSGDSEGHYTTMGYQEAEDLVQITDLVEEKYGKGVFLGTHGESMGGATVLLHMCRDKRVRFVVADCPYSDLKEQVFHVLRSKARLFPPPLFWLAAIMVRIKAGFWVTSISPIREIRNQEGLPQTPLLLIHGTEDRFILCEESIRLQQAKKGKVSLYLCKGAAHAKSLQTNKSRYEQVLDEFLNSIAL